MAIVQHKESSLKGKVRRQKGYREEKGVKESVQMKETMYKSLCIYRKKAEAKKVQHPQM